MHNKNIIEMRMLFIIKSYICILYTLKKKINFPPNHCKFNIRNYTKKSHHMTFEDFLGILPEPTENIVNEDLVVHRLTC